MAVLVRSASRSIPFMKRALVAAGVPVVVAEDETPLVEEPAVSVLLSALTTAVAIAEGRPPAGIRARSSTCSPRRSAEWIPPRVRRVARELRRRDVRVAPEEGRAP